MAGNDMLLQDAFLDARPTSDGWYRAACPFCEQDGHSDKKHSLALRVDNGWYQCWRCGSKGFAKNLQQVEEWEDEPAPNGPPIDRRQLVPESPPSEAPLIALPDGYIELGVDPGLTALSLSRARAYLVKRGIPSGVWREARIGAVTSGYYGRRVVIPIFNGGNCYGWVARTWGDADLKYLYPKGMKRSQILYNQDALYEDTTRPLLVVEGVFDALNLWPDAVAVLGKPAGEHLRMLCQTSRHIAVALDSDARSESEALAMSLNLHSKRAGFVELPVGSDPAELPAAWVKRKAATCLEV